MKRTSVLLATLLVGTTLASAPLWAQGMNPPTSDRPAATGTTTSPTTPSDTSAVAGGLRASKISGSAVYNAQDERVGSVDDLIIGQGDRALYAVLSVGGFLGMGSHLVAVPYNRLSVSNDKVILSDATKDSLKSMPEFKYAAEAPRERPAARDRATSPAPNTGPSTNR
jgi:hypothetical protein